MKRLITLLDSASGTELVLPVTPAAYDWARQAAIETVAIDQIGDANFFGGRSMASSTLRDCIFPAQSYPFLSPGASTDPWTYVERIGSWIDSGTVLRFIVSGTPVNEAVLIEALAYREQDGTNDLYADITLRQYIKPETPVLPAQAEAQPGSTRDDSTGAAQTRTYEIVSGDTMWDICRRFYGDGSLCWRLAAYNEIANANIIYPGQVLTIPPAEQLPAEAAKPRGAQIAEATVAELDLDVDIDVENIWKFVLPAAAGVATWLIT